MDQVNRKAGQAITEYILLLAILISIFTMFMKGLTDTGALLALKKPLEKDFKFTYQYGHPEARGQNDGGPKFIPQHHDPQNFRIFINPPINE
jgi:hypothetical protein